MNRPWERNGRKFRNKNRRNRPKDEVDNINKASAVPPQTVTGSEISQDGVTNKIQERKEPCQVKDSVFKDLPAPVLLQLIALTKLINSLFTEHGMSNEDIARRSTVFQEFKQLLQTEIPDCTVRLYGSSQSYLGLKSSDVNIDVYDDKEEKIPRIFMMLLNLLKNSGKYSDIKEEFQTKRPTINFTDFKSGLRCRVSTENNSSFLTNNLLNIYGELDNRVRPLCVAFKLWAKICKVDCQAVGTLPSYSFLLMVVHFLQQTNPPILPVIHELGVGDLTKYICTKQNDIEVFLKQIRGEWVTKNTSCLGALWLGLLRYYCEEEKLQSIIINVTQGKTCLRSERNWGKKYKFAIEDPFSTKRNVARSLSKSSAYRFIIGHLKIALFYFGRFPGSVLTKIPGDGNQCNILGESLDKVENKLQEDHDENETRSENNEDDGGRDDEELVDGIFTMDTINDDIVINDENSGVGDHDDGDTTVAPTDQSLISETSYSVKETIVKSPESKTCLLNSKHAPGDMARQSDTSSEPSDVHWSNVQYIFDDSVLRKGPPLDTKCNSCGEDGHIADNCTVEKKKVFKNLPKPTDWFNEMLTKVCERCKDDFGISEDEVNKRQFSLKALQAYIRCHFPDAELHLFGSSCNGFGFHKSDLDICMMFKGKTKNDIDCISTITSLRGILRGNPECIDVIAITGAKVPIVKFVLKRTKDEADISLYNEVALWNTKLLATYVAIDRRVQVLGCTLKIFVKLCDIGDASRGSLSSYAYILMLLHFLQQCDPPVLPVLQELYDTKEKPQSIVEGFNCWFYDDLKNLHEELKFSSKDHSQQLSPCDRHQNNSTADKESLNDVIFSKPIWPQNSTSTSHIFLTKLGTKWKAQNTKSCGELWLGFLRYFTETFDYQQHVVCVRSRKPLTKFEKMWNGKKISIEDPFVLTHNLGAGLSPTMAKFILSTFEKARERFGTPRRDISENIELRQRFFFDPVFLNSGHMPPTGRNCNICGRIGHWAKECSYNRTNRAQDEKKLRKKTQEDNKVEKKKEEGDSLKFEQSQAPLKPDNDTNISQTNNSMVSSPSTIRDSQTKDMMPTQQNVNPSSPSSNQFSPPQMAVLLPSSSPKNHGPPTSPLRPNIPGHLALSGRTLPLAPCFSQSPHLQRGSIGQMRNPFPSSPPSVDQRTSIQTQFPNFSSNISQDSGNSFLQNSPPFRHSRPQPLMSPPPLMSQQPRGHYGKLLVRANTPKDFINSSSPDPMAVCSQPSTRHYRYPQLIPNAKTPNDTLNSLTPNQSPLSVSPQPIFRGHYSEQLQRATTPTHFLNSSPPRQQRVSESPQTMTRGCYAEIIPIRSNDLMNKSPHSRVITCEDLENPDGLVNAFDRDQVDGWSPISSTAVVEHANTGFSPSVLQTLQSMNISDCSGDQHVEPGSASKKQSYVNTHSPKYQEISGIGDMQVPFRERRVIAETPERFSTPPNVRNILAEELKDVSSNPVNPLHSPKKQVPENKDTETRDKNGAADSHSETDVTKLKTEKAKDSATRHNPTIEDDDVKTVVSGDQSRKRRNQRRSKKSKGGQKNETSDGSAVEQNDVSSMKRVDTDKQKETAIKKPVRSSMSSSDIKQVNDIQVKNKKSEPPNYQTHKKYRTPIAEKKDTKGTEHVGLHAEKQVHKESLYSGQVEGGKMKERKSDTFRQINSQYEDCRPQNLEASAKPAETLLSKVNGPADQRKAQVVESGKDAIGGNTQSNRRRQRRARSRKKNRTDKADDIAICDENNAARRGGHQNNSIRGSVKPE